MMQELVCGGVVSTYTCGRCVVVIGERVMQWGIGIGGWAGVVWGVGCVGNVSVVERSSLITLQSILPPRSFP